MVARITADAALALHGLWVAFLAGGVLIVRRHPWAQRLHVGGLVLTLTLDLTGTPCPLTIVETALRLRCGLSRAYRGSCITHYPGGIFPILAWPGLQLWAEEFLLGIALTRYGFLRRGPIRTPRPV
jgi:hypothetical protein